MSNGTPLGWLSSVLLASWALAAGTAWGIEEPIENAAALRASGALVICGGGDVSESVMQHFIELAGGRRAKIVHVPTAAEGADRDEVDEDLEYFRRQPLGSLTVFHTRSPQQANDPDFARPLAEATGVWLGGGSQCLLADAYLGTAAEGLIRQVLNRGGVVGGISAGAAVMSPVMIRGGESEPEVGPGFGLLPGTIIDQHFLKRNRQGRLLRVLADHPSLVGIGIDEHAALIVKDGRLTVMGDSDVVTCLGPSADSPARVERMRPGDEADLPALILAAQSRMPVRQPASPKQAQTAPSSQRAKPSGKDVQPAYVRQFPSAQPVQSLRSQPRSQRARPYSTPARRRVAWSVPVLAR